MRMKVLLCAAAAFGQALVGLPEAGVTLGGTVDAPVVLNNSGRPILGEFLRLEDANGHGRMLDNFNTRRIWWSGAVNSAVDVSPKPVAVTVAGQPSLASVVKVIIETVIFADGEFVGADSARRFDHMAAKVKAEGDLGRELAAVRHHPSRYEEVWAHIMTLWETPDPVKFYPDPKTELDDFALFEQHIRQGTSSIREK